MQDMPNLMDKTHRHIRQEVFDTLMSKSPGGVVPDEFDKEAMRRAIDGLLANRWLPGEIVRYLKWTEHVNPIVGEEEALANMARIKAEVEARLKNMARIKKM